MRPRGSAEALEMRRMIAANLLEEGLKVSEVARLVGVNPGTVSRWKQVLETQGREGLRAKRPPVRKRKLSPSQLETLRDLLQQGARAAGFPTELWTLKRVAQVIEQRFGVRYHPGHVWRLLRELGFTPQKPERRARKRDEQAIQAWRAEDWPRVREAACQQGKAILFVDESGMLLQPLVRRTWALRGQTPILSCWERRERWSALGGLLVQPGVEGGIQWISRLQEGNVKGEDVAALVEEVAQAIGKLVVVWDRWSAHRKAERLLRERGMDDVEVEYLPAYAPELNPVEQVWGYTKYGVLANFVPRDKEELRERVEQVFREVNTQPQKLWNFLRHTGLALEAPPFAL